MVPTKRGSRGGAFRASMWTVRSTGIGHVAMTPCTASTTGGRRRRRSRRDVAAELDRAGRQCHAAVHVVHTVGISEVGQPVGDRLDGGVQVVAAQRHDNGQRDVVAAHHRLRDELDRSHSADSAKGTGWWRSELVAWAETTVSVTGALVGRRGAVPPEHLRVAAATPCGGPVTATSPGWARRTLPNCGLLHAAPVELVTRRLPSACPIQDLAFADRLDRIDGWWTPCRT